VRQQVTQAAVPAVTQAQRDSIRLLSEQSARREERMLGLLRDSVANAVRRSMSDSISREREAELAQARVKDSVARASRVFLNMPPLTVGSRSPGGPTREQFTERAQHMGPPRRIGVSIYSGIRNASVSTAAAVLRDSITSRLRANGRYVVVPADEVTSALAKSRNIDSMRAATHADLWVTISGLQALDSLTWNITVRDFSANSVFSQRAASSKRVQVGDAGAPPVVIPLSESVLRELDAMDRAPRRGSVTEIRIP